VAGYQGERLVLKNVTELDESALMAAIDYLSALQEESAAFVADETARIDVCIQQVVFLASYPALPSTLFMQFHSPRHWHPLYLEPARLMFAPHIYMAVALQCSRRTDCYREANI
jgi:hypothetical protein